VNDLASALRDPFVAELGALWEVDHSEKGTLREVACPVRLSDTAPLPRRAAPGLGEHSEEILAGLVGPAEDEVRELRDREVI
jgi:crotonobetainyl-CoA:carnitine CoA-transferase CaiB-like acyl-CoA transferase